LSALELKIPPVAVTVLFAMAMWLLARVTPGVALAWELRLAALVLGLTAGTAIGLAGVWSFRKARTTVNPLRPDSATALVVDGVFRFTRNPMYLGLLIVLVGWGLYLVNPLSLLLALAFVPYMNRFQIGPEECALERAYGRYFTDYCHGVRRWL
jgi:protein-S-isoprenylcysteine O-methyltransferase Ste14